MSSYIGGKAVNWLTRSSDNGVRWDTIRRCPSSAPVCVYADGDLVIVTHGGSFVTADSLGRIIMSTDRGTTWSDISGNFQHLMGFTFHNLASLAMYDRTTLIAGVDAGTGVLLRKLDINTTSVSEGSDPDADPDADLAAYIDAATGLLRLSLPMDGSRYSVMNARGQTVASGILTGNAIDLGDAPPGLYVVTVHTDAEIRRVKVLK
ncbi:MAG: hypothetical protein ACKOAG_01590 [Candidatus Kapaibacterium sp.]